MIEHRHVQSTDLGSERYDSEAKTLAIRFRRANVYQYFDVPAQVYEGLLSAPSTVLNSTPTSKLDPASDEVADRTP